MENYYEILELDSSQSCDELRRTLVRQRRSWQTNAQDAPDIETQQLAERMIETIREAMDILTDPERRAEYDLKLSHVGSAIAMPQDGETSFISSRLDRLVALVEQQMISGNPERALRTLHDSPIYAARSDDPLIQITEAFCLMKLGRTEEGKQLYEKAQNVDLNAADENLLSKLTLFEFGYIPEKANECRITPGHLERWPDSDGLYKAYCLKQIQGKKYHEAETMLERYLKLHGTSSQAKYMGGEIYALLALEHTIAYDEEDELYIYENKEEMKEFGRLAELAEQTGHSKDTAKLLEAYRKGLKIGLSPIGICAFIMSIIYWILGGFLPVFSLVFGSLMAITFISVLFQFVPRWIHARQAAGMFRPGPTAILDIIPTITSFPVYWKRIRK